MLRFDGLYVAPIGAQVDGGAPVCSYLRFYSGRAVLAVSSSNQPHQVAMWNSWEEVWARGTYTIRDGVLRFTTRYDPSWEEWEDEATRNRIIVVDYSGTISGETLMLDWHNSSLDSTGKNAYSFAVAALSG